MMGTTITDEKMSGSASEENHSSDCEKVVNVFEKWLEGKASEADEEFLAEQADECSPCFESIDKQQQFVQFLNNALRRPGTPAALVDTIKTKIHHSA